MTLSLNSGFSSQLRTAGASGRKSLHTRIGIARVRIATAALPYRIRPYSISASPFAFQFQPATQNGKSTLLVLQYCLCYNNRTSALCLAWSRGSSRTVYPTLWDTTGARIPVPFLKGARYTPAPTCTALETSQYYLALRSGPNPASPGSQALSQPTGSCLVLRADLKESGSPHTLRTSCRVMRSSGFRLSMA